MLGFGVFAGLAGELAVARLARFGAPPRYGNLR